MINKLVVENLKHRPIRTALTVLAIGLQVTMILTLVGLSRGMLEGFATRNRGVGADIIVRPSGTALIGLSSTPMPEKILDFVRRQPNVTLVTGTAVHPIGGIDSVSGIDLPSFEKISGGFRYLEGRAFEAPDEILVDEYYARQNKLHAGDPLQLMGRKWRVAGVVESGKLARLFVPLRVLQELTSNTGKISFVYAKVDEQKNIQGVVASLRKQLPENPIYAMEEYLSLVSIQNVPGLNQFITVIVALAVIFGFLIVFLAMYTAVLERTREIGILKALGASPVYIMNILVRETVLLALIGSVVGILLTYAARLIIMTRYPASLTQVIVPDWWPIAGAIALLGAVLGALYPGLKAVRQDAIEALAYE